MLVALLVLILLLMLVRGAGIHIIIERLYVLVVIFVFVLAPVLELDNVGTTEGRQYTWADCFREQRAHQVK